MDEGMPGSALERRRCIPPWMTLLGSLVLAFVLLILIVCVILPVMATLVSASTTNLAAQTLLELGCQQKNPDLPGDTCRHWATGASGSSSPALEACRGRLDRTGSARDPAAWYQCMIDQGVDPPR